MTATKPDCVHDDHLVYLDELRESGVTNMFGAGPFLQKQFGLSLADARVVLLYWMNTFDQRQ